MSIAAVAAENLNTHLKQNAYPGRGLIVGQAADGASWLEVYWIMGRSPNSRNRKFASEGVTLSTEPFDASKVEDPSLIIYEAMLELPGVYLVSNGDQTRTLHDTLAAGGTFEGALATREREPDAPNYTPRISGMLDSRGDEPEVALNILKANPTDPEQTDRYTVRPAAPPAGYGLCITTYMGDGSPLPPFVGDPLVMPLDGNAETVLATYWDALDDDNRISLAVKSIAADGSSKILVKNQYV
ncbi:MAG: inosine monophosphate cyclohydrolase [Lentisphaerae bacterium]|nr:inosine monophosphate cyclohydrolase [Lentisphaerota bacterium]MBT4815158.1 inosine monophosphate cyclohydrolase [Lentisphaerota bacterium]MBT5612572.1 inosine monophosphate cyclohydrolase [Lentisphaerota bacterium]MBT7844954.1 inosine monophosphate cyclohydrolase [Lentisphaerota bacterium]